MDTERLWIPFNYSIKHESVCAEAALTEYVLANICMTPPTTRALLRVNTQTQWQKKVCRHFYFHDWCSQFYILCTITSSLKSWTELLPRKISQLWPSLPCAYVSFKIYQKQAIETACLQDTLNSLLILCPSLEMTVGGLNYHKLLLGCLFWGW